MSLESEYFAIIDTQKEQDRLCYASPDVSDPSKRLMAIFDKKPKIPKEWQHCKKVVKVKITVL